jgi:hypothetical protein
MWSSVKSSAAPAGGAAAGAVLGSLAGPLGMVLGAATGAVVAHAIEENASLRSGDTVGREALEREIARWKGKAVAASQMAEAEQRAASGLKTSMRWAAGALAAIWLLFPRSRQQFLEALRDLVTGHPLRAMRRLLSGLGFLHSDPVPDRAPIGTLIRRRSAAREAPRRDAP